MHFWKESKDLDKKYTSSLSVADFDKFQEVRIDGCHLPDLLLFMGADMKLGCSNNSKNRDDVMTNVWVWI